MVPGTRVTGDQAPSNHGAPAPRYREVRAPGPGPGTRFPITLLPASPDPESLDPESNKNESVSDASALMATAVSGREGQGAGRPSDTRGRAALGPAVHPDDRAGCRLTPGAGRAGGSGDRKACIIYIGAWPWWREDARTTGARRV
ncbi:MAG: hypothetical protein K6T65_14930 [Peptococcaceae bacterium]|nr:hypothetical protein [Peptococcaceae bacterium]